MLLVLELRGRGHRHPRHRHDHYPHGHPDSHAPRALLPFVVSFGAAASPDLTILPVFLAATAAGAGAAVGSLVVFALVTVTTFVVLTVAAAAGGHQLADRWLKRSGNLITVAVLVLLGAVVLAGVL